MAYHQIVDHARQFKLIGENTVRLFKVAYPLLAVKANYHIMADNRNFHLIQRYMLNMVAGEAEGLPDLPPILKGRSLVKDKAELLQLLGLTHQFWDVASDFYEHLVMSGQIVETDMGLYIDGQVPKNATTIRTPTPRQILATLIIDPQDCRICKKTLQTIKPKDANTIIQQNQKKISMLSFPTFVYDPNLLEQRLNEVNFNFENAAQESLTRQLEEQGVPVNAKGVALYCEDDSPTEVLYIPCYLAVEQTEEGTMLQLYHVHNGAPVTELSINGPSHEALQQQIAALTAYRGDLRITVDLTPSVKLPIRGSRGIPEATVTELENGNYRTTITDQDLAKALMEQKSIVEEILPLLLETYPLVISDFEAGRFLYVELTEPQKQLCQTVQADVKNRLALVEAYLADTGGLTPQMRFALGSKYFDNDPEKAFSHFLTAAPQDGYSAFMTSLCYFCGHGVQKDMEAAYQWCLSAHEKNVLPATHNLGVFHYAGHLGEKDYKKALPYFIQAANDGFVLSQNVLGTCLQNGYGVEADSEAAFLQYQKAAESGHIAAQYCLASCYQKGLGTEKDETLCQYWLDRALAPREDDTLVYFGAEEKMPRELMHLIPDEIRKQNTEALRSIISLAKKKAEHFQIIKENQAPEV